METLRKNDESKIFLNLEEFIRSSNIKKKNYVGFMDP